MSADEVRTEIGSGLLLELERELAAGDGAAYARRLAETAIVVVPNVVLDKGQTIAQIDAAGGWDDFLFTEEREDRLGLEAGLVTYRFSGTRGSLEYTAQLTSVYRRESGGAWRLILHQQTPLE